MRLSVERLRWGLLAGAPLLIAVLVVLLSYGRYRAVEAWKQIVKRSGVKITHEADEVTYSQALGGKQIFTLHAKREIPHGNGQYTLEDGMLELYGPNGKVTDRISGAQIEYDENKGVAHAAGEVDMEIEPPAGMASANKGNGTSGAAAQVMHVRTSGLTYVKKLGVAATDQDVEIDYAGIHGHARGAEFDTERNVVHLLADVHAVGDLHGTPATLTATKADLDRDQEEIDLTNPIMRSNGRTGSADHAVLHLRKDGSLEAMEANGSVTLKQDTRTITAASMRSVMNERSQMKNADLAGGVGLVDTNAERPMRGAAKTAKIAFDDAGYATSAVMDGAVTLSMEDKRSGPALSAGRAGSPGTPLGRQMGADHVTLTMERVAQHGERVSTVHAQGAAWVRGDAAVQATGGKSGGIKTTSVAGDDLRLVLARDAAGKDQPQTLNGAGHTRIEQRMPDGTVQKSVGDVLEARFAEQAGQASQGQGLEIASAEQTGNVKMRSVPGKTGELPSDGVAERASLDGASNVVTLTGRPRLTQGDTNVTADVIRLMQQTGDAVATGNVAGTFVNANAQAGSPVTHALAAEAVLHKAAQTMDLKGTDAAPARMWQGPSQVQAANLFLDRTKDSLQAWPAGPQGVVRSVFASAGSPGGQAAASAASKTQRGSGAPNGERAVRVTSARLDYSGVSHEAVFTGGVVAEGEDGTATGQRAVAFLVPKQPGKGAAAVSKAPDAKGQPDPMAASVERIVMSGAVKVVQPGRTATGEQLLYTAATGEFVLTGTAGHPPHVVDEKQGNITGATLVFRSPDSTIVVAGESASRRVHTETTIKR
jgi:lipopolysaccharide export system protein LptA